MTTNLLASKPIKRRIPDLLLILIVLMAVFNGLPFLAPLFMKLGWETPGRLIYLAYSFLCHQMAQRSFFLFGPQGFQMYGLAELPVKATGPTAELALKQFLGNSEMGWKVAWSDRMVAMYLSPLLTAVVYAAVRRRSWVKALPLWAFGLFLLPMLLDGGTHMISDFASGIGHGFRDSNVWLAVITAHKFPASFYSGDELGSFNSWMRLLSGLSFGIGLGWLVFPWLDSPVVSEEYPLVPSTTEPSPYIP
jgi:uncharacterized membrane protein